MNFLKRFLKDEKGASFLEYMLLAGASLAIVATYYGYLGQKANQKIQKVNTIMAGIQNGASNKPKSP